MKAFEKYMESFKNVRINGQPAVPPPAEVWIAALEWALKQRVPLDMDYAMRYRDFAPGPIDPELIKEELNKDETNL